jgi:hypothetical protein
MPSLFRPLCISLALVIFASAQEKSGHLFIMSGQSNMTDSVKRGFTEVVTKALGEDKVSIVHQCKPGRGIRFWVADYALPEDHPMASLSKNKSNGENFPELVEKAKGEGDATKFKTVTFVWMQGESDAHRDLGVAYERSFKVLMERLKKEIGIEQMYFVIGRISDYGLHNEEKKKGWQGVREAQQKLAEGDPLGAWINTDDFIAEEVKKNQGDLHYTPQEAVKLGTRLGEAALKQLAEAK